MSLLIEWNSSSDYLRSRRLFDTCYPLPGVSTVGGSEFRLCPWQLKAHWIKVHLYLWTLVTSDIFLCLVWTVYDLAFRLAMEQKPGKWRPGQRYECSDRLAYLTVRKFWAQNLHCDKKPSLKLSGSELHSWMYYIINCRYVSQFCWPLVRAVRNPSIDHKISNVSSPQKMIQVICTVSLMKIKTCKKKSWSYSVQL